MRASTVALKIQFLSQLCHSKSEDARSNDGEYVKVVVVQNNTLGQIKWEQMVFEGNPEYAVELQPIDFAGVAMNCGAADFTIERPQGAEDAPQQAVKGGVILDHRSGGKIDHFLVQQGFLCGGFAGAAGAEACDPLAGRV